MGGRGGYSTGEYSADVTRRAKSLTKTMNESGLTVVKSQKEVEAVVRKYDRENLKKVMYPTHIQSYQKGFFRSANADSKQGYKEEMEHLMKRINNFPESITSITERAQVKHKMQMSKIERKMQDPDLTDKAYKSLLQERERTWGKLQAANFINWARKPR